METLQLPEMDIPRGIDPSNRSRRVTCAAFTGTTQLGAAFAAFWAGAPRNKGCPCASEQGRHTDGSRGGFTGDARDASSLAM